MSELAPCWLQGVLLGLVQGITEFLPISSSAHLVLLPSLTGWPYLGKAFDVALHFGTLIAIVVFFEKELRGLLEVFRRYPEASSDLQPQRRLLHNLILATAPAALLGLILDEYLERTFGGMGSIALFLASFGFVLGWSDERGTKCREMWQLTPASAFIIGCAQALALVPGVSRCGITISAGLWVGLTRAEAARFSFLMALPITGGAFLLRGLKLIWSPGAVSPEQTLACGLGMAAAACSGAACIRFLLTYLQDRSFWPFVYYRLTLAAGLFMGMALLS